MTDKENTAAVGEDGFTPAERAYFNSRGESSIPEPKPPAEPKPEPAPEPESSPLAATPEEPKDEEPKLEASVTGDESKAPVEGEKQKVVDHGALHRERELRKQAEASLQEARLLQARMEERFKMWREEA